MATSNPRAPAHFARARFRWLSAGVLASAAGCAPETPVASGPDYDPPTARPEVLAELVADLEAVRHAGDGGGRAWIVTEDERPPPVEARTRASVELAYAAGPEGIRPDGSLVLLVGPYWRWSSPQVDDPDAPGFTRVACAAEGVELELDTPAPWTLRARVRGRALVEDERVTISYGAGPLGAKADDFAERGSRFWFRVDGDGDGVSGLIEDSPRIDVAPGRAAAMLVWLPSTARVGEQARLSVALVDRWANAGVAWSGRVAFEVSSDGLALPVGLELTPEDKGAKSVLVDVERAGVFRVRAHAVATPGEASTSTSFDGESNPLCVDGGDRILWADLHGHSNYSDGTGLPDDYYAYARDVAALDAASLTDHDHFGIEFLDQHPALWGDIERATAAFNTPGRFVTILGYEWTNWIHGHRHVLLFADRGPMHSSLDPATDTPPELWSVLRGAPASSVAHHPGGGPIAMNWTFAPDPEVETVVEVVSVHGSSESLDSPQVIYGAEPGHFARDVLARGAILGFIGSGDSHDGHPGLAHLQGGCGGLAAILSEACTREGIRAALRSRACYATSGPRIVLRAALGAHRMGSVIQDARGSAASVLAVSVVAPAPLARLELMGRNGVIERIDCGGEREFRNEFQLGSGDHSFVYVRVVAQDDHFAVSSPFFFD